jgi:Heterokaryon incompatibility protein (HET)
MSRHANFACFSYTVAVQDCSEPRQPWASTEFYPKIPWGPDSGPSEKEARMSPRPHRLGYTSLLREKIPKPLSSCILTFTRYCLHSSDPFTMSSSISYSANRSPCEIYSPLRTSQRETRLVTLQPGLTHELTCCTLSIVSLSAVHDDYEALSYVWGDPLIRENIELDGVEFQVTTNLHAALRHLRWVTRPRLLWIDAVCINQTNAAERSKQVSLMTEIYKYAKQVIVWLGESSHDSLRAMHFLDIIAQKPSQEFLSENPKDGNNPLAVFNRTRIDVQPLRMAEKPPQDEFLVEAAMNLLKRPWFRRGWVLQEVVLASKALVYCGQRSISWDDLSLAACRITEIGAIDIRVRQLSRLKEGPLESVL